MTVRSFIKILGTCFLLNCAIAGGGCAPSDPAAEIVKGGDAFEKNGQNEKAMAEYDRALEVNSQSADAYYSRGLLYMKQGDLNKALSDFNKVIAINPDYSQPYYRRGLICEAQGQSDKAIEEYTKAIENNNVFGLAYAKRSKLYNSKGEYRKALDDAQKARTIGEHISDDDIKQMQESASRQK